MVESLLLKGKDFLLRMFDIRPGEFKRLWLMQLHVFVLIQGLWIVKPIVNAQFLLRVGIERLPLVFLLVAICAMVVSTSYSRLLNKLPLGTIMKRTYLVSIFCLSTFAVLLSIDQFPPWLSYLFYIGVALFGLVTTSQFWLMGNLVFSSMEAKRLFGIIGAGAIAGGISGGYVTSALAPLMDSQNLLFMAVGLLVIILIINQNIWKTFVPAFNRTVQIRQTITRHEYPLRLIRNSKHLTYIALIMGVSVVVAKLVEFQFSAIASERIKDPDELSAYFGFWFSTSNVVALGIQLLLTQRILGLLGVGRSLFFLPGALFAGAVAVLYAPVLWAGTTIKLFDISLKQSINKAATELLIVPVPLAIKTQAKTFIDIFVDTTATGIGGIVLIFLINGFDLSVRAVSIMILGLICIWLYFAVRVRKEYVLAFERKLGILKHTQAKKDYPSSRTPVVEGVRSTLENGSIKQILFLLAQIEEIRDVRLMPNVIPLLKHDSPLVRQAALRCLYYHPDQTLTSKIEPLLKDKDDEVRSRAFSTLLSQTRNNRVNFINDHLQAEDPVISGAALVGLATEACDNPVMQQKFKLEQRIEEKINQTEDIIDPEERDAHKIMMARAIGYGKLSKFYPVLFALMKDKNPKVMKQAIVSAGTSQDPRFIHPLLSYLPAKRTRAIAKNALTRYEPAHILPMLRDVIHEDETRDELLLQLPTLVENMDTQQTVDFLFELVRHHDPVAKLEALESLHNVKLKFPHLTISGKRVIPVLVEEVQMYRQNLAIQYAAQQRLNDQPDNINIRIARNELMELLESRLNCILERIFWIMGLAYRPGVIMPLLIDLRNKDIRIRMNTVELLDNILDPPLRKVVMPIVETEMTDVLSHDDIVRLVIDIPDEKTYFENLLKGDDDLLKLAVLKLIEALDDPDLDPLVAMAANDAHIKVSSYAEKILAKA